MKEKLWVHSADSHVLEPNDLWRERLPARLGERAPWTERTDDREIVHVDGEIVLRHLNSFVDSFRPPGSEDMHARLADLDAQGVHAEAIFPSRGLWLSLLTDRELSREAVRVYNDWVAENVLAVSERLIGTAALSMVDTDDAVAELHRAIDLGFRAIFMSCTPPADRPYYDPVWDPLWHAAAEADVPLCFHVGTGANIIVARGPGGAVINYVETFFPAQRVITHLVSAGVLDRHPNLKVFVAEAGASWVPALADRMDEAYRQHHTLVRPKLSTLPSEQIFRQVYASFQHDRSAVPAVSAMGYRNVMWGSDYPHLEGTFPNTQDVLHELFDGVDEGTRDRITVGAFAECFGLASATDSEASAPARR